MLPMRSYRYGPESPRGVARRQVGGATSCQERKLWLKKCVPNGANRWHALRSGRRPRHRPPGEEGLQPLLALLCQSRRRHVSTAPDTFRLLSTPQRVLYRGREPERRLTPSGATWLLAGPLVLTALAVALGLLPWKSARWFPSCCS